MSITVEFFGIPRQRAGLSQTEATGTRLNEVLADLALRFPDLGHTCIDQDHLRAGFIANLDGQRFISDPCTPLHAGDCLLILSADAGG
jgi:sulfur-carrier protein